MVKTWGWMSVFENWRKHAIAGERETLRGLEIKYAWFMFDTSLHTSWICADYSCHLLDVLLHIANGTWTRSFNTIEFYDLTCKAESVIRGGCFLVMTSHENRLGWTVEIAHMRDVSTSHQTGWWERGLIGIWIFWLQWIVTCWPD